MIALPHRANQQLAVFGLGGSGLAAATALRRSGAGVLAWDDDERSRRAAAAADVPLADLRGCDWSGLAALVLSPGVPLTHPAPHPVVAAARAAGCAVIGDVELLAEACPQATFAGITGTNGKSTTTALLGHILAASGRKVEIGGNLGPPALALTPLGTDGCYVLELSSFQLDLIHAARFDPAVLLNVTPDHLDRHGDIDGYVAAKRRIFRRRRGAQTAVVGVDDEHGEALAAELEERPGWRVVRISSGRRLRRGVYALDGRLYDAADGRGPAKVADLRPIETLPGVHNRQNAAAAFAAARALGVAAAEAARHLPTYPGLPHRQETVATIGGVRYVNDSKATNGDAAARALACYRPIYWIAGGLAKADGLDAAVGHADRIRQAFLIGQAAERFARELDGRVAVTRAGDLASAVRAAHRLAQAEGLAGAVVLLSPACASFDQWKDFAARGEAFRSLVRELGDEARR